MHKILAPLNQDQRQAVKALEGPVLILAGAGSGKTKTLVHRIAYLIDYKGVKPYNILAVTFTNKAATEMKSRIKKLLGKDVKHMPIMGTFHSICVQILRREINKLGYSQNFVIFDDKDSSRLIKKIIKDIGYGQDNISPKSIQILISRAKNHLINPTDYELQSSGMIENITSKVYQRYQRELRENNALDFDDLIMQAVMLFKENPKILEKYQKIFAYILVDEYQDTNQAQYILISMLAQKHKNLCVVGDDFQSIYSWRGANMENILNFEKDYPKAKVVLLEQNYRSTKNIINASNEIIKYNVTQKDKKLWTENPHGSKVSIKEATDERQEGEYIIKSILNIKEKEAENNTEELVYEPEDSILDKVMKSPMFQKNKSKNLVTEEMKMKMKITDFSKFVVLYRTNAQSRALEEVFLSYSVPYRIIGSIKFYERREIKDIISYLRVLVNPKDWVSLERIINVPPRGIGKVSFSKIEKQCRDLEKNILEIKEEELPKIQTKARASFLNIQNILKTLSQKTKTLEASKIIELVAEATGYKKFILDGSKEGENRWENILELKSVTRKFKSLKGQEAINAFLEDVSLVSDQDEIDENAQAVNMMTIHAAKGLEFKEVFIVGMEEGLFPHSRSIHDPQEMEEERRLCYVALTRAKNKVHLVYALRRTIYGSEQLNSPSRFIEDIPENLIDQK